MAISGTAGDRTAVSRAWNSFCNQAPDARQEAKLPPPYFYPCGLAEDRVCQPLPDTRLVHHSHSRLKPSAWARKAKYIAVGKKAKKKKKIRQVVRTEPQSKTMTIHPAWSWVL